MSDPPPPPSPAEGRSVRATTIASRERVRLLVTKRGKNRGRGGNSRGRPLSRGGTPNPPAAPVHAQPNLFNMTTNPIPTAVLNALSPTKKAALEAWARTATAPVFNLTTPTIKIRQPNINVKIPKYDPFRKTATGYLEEVEAYFKSQGVDKAEFLEVVPTVLEDHTISWLRSKKTAGYNWDTFKTDFTARFDDVATQQRRQNYLVTRRQKEDEPVETFVWEMMDLAKQVFPTETTAASVERCRNGLNPRLKVALAELTTSTAEHLIDRCLLVIQDLRELDRVEGRRSKLPPMHSYANIRLKHKSNFQSFTPTNVNNRQPGSWNRGHQEQSSSQQSTSQSNPQPSSSTTNAYSQKQHFKQITRGTYKRPGNQGGSRHADKTCYQCK